MSKKHPLTFCFLLGGSAGSGYVTQYNLNLYESLTELRVEVSSSTSTRSTRVSLAEPNILLALAEAGAGGGDNGGNGYSGGGCVHSDGGSDGSSGLCEDERYHPGQGSGISISELRFQHFELRYNKFSNEIEMTLKHSFLKVLEVEVLLIHTPMVEEVEVF